MKTSIVTVPTVTIGLKGKKVLAAKGIKSSIVKIDYTKNQNGCQYGIKFNERDYYDVISALRERGIEYGVYTEK